MFSISIMSIDNISITVLFKIMIVISDNTDVWTKRFNHLCNTIRKIRVFYGVPEHIYFKAAMGFKYPITYCQGHYFPTTFLLMEWFLALCLTFGNFYIASKICANSIYVQFSSYLDLSPTKIFPLSSLIFSWQVYLKIEIDWLFAKNVSMRKGFYDTV